ncbi:hypothetical protein D3C75_891600 [compost metagenome]
MGVFVIGGAFADILEQLVQNLLQHTTFLIDFMGCGFRRDDEDGRELRENDAANAARIKRPLLFFIGIPQLVDEFELISVAG